MNNVTALLRSRDVAYILDISPNEVIELVHRRRLKAAKKGKFWRFCLRDVMAYKHAQKEPRTWLSSRDCVPKCARRAEGIRE